MNESRAWLEQAIGDRTAGERLAGPNEAHLWCHAIAKCQQTVEKAIKAIVVSLRETGLLAIDVGYRHEVERFLQVLIRLPHGERHKSLQQFLRGLLDERTRADIRSLDSLAPRRPPPGDPPRKNTEYPFQDSGAAWTFPAASGVFSLSELQRFRTLSHRIVVAAERVLPAARRKPR